LPSPAVAHDYVIVFAESDHSDDDEFEENPKQGEISKSKSSESLKNKEGNEGGPEKTGSFVINVLK
jgi:hypothetical protein